jgi:hypothetical protein
MVWDKGMDGCGKDCLPERRHAGQWTCFALQFALHPNKTRTRTFFIGCGAWRLPRTFDLGGCDEEFDRRG